MDLSHINNKVLDFGEHEVEIIDETMSSLITTYIMQEGLGQTFKNNTEAIEHMLIILYLFPRLEQEDIEDLTSYLLYQVQEDN